MGCCSAAKLARRAMALTSLNEILATIAPYALTTGAAGAPCARMAWRMSNARSEKRATTRWWDDSEALVVAYAPALEESTRPKSTTDMVPASQRWGKDGREKGR